MDYNEKYIEKNPTLHREDAYIKFKELLLEIKKLPNVERFIDIGCGCSQLTYLLFKLLKPQKAVGLGLSPKMIKEAKNTFENKAIEWTIADVQTYTHSTKFDLVICADLIEHIPNDVEIIKKICNWGQKVIIRIPLEDSLINKWLKKLGISNELQKTEEKYGHVHHYSVKLFLNKVKKAKLKINSYQLYKINVKRSWWLNEIYRKVINHPLFPLPQKASVKLGGEFLVITSSNKK